MGKKEKKKFNFAAYFLIMLGVIFAVVIICLAILFFAPGTSILGYEYFYYTDTVTEEIHQSAISASPKKAIKLSVHGTSKIIVKPNMKNESINLIYAQDASGIYKSLNAKYKISKSQKFMTEGIFKNCATLYLDVYEPSGWSVGTKSVITLELPQTLHCEVLYIEGEKASIYFQDERTQTNKSGEDITRFFGCEKAYLKCKNRGNVEVFKPKHITDFDLGSEYGSMAFTGVESLNLDELNISTSGGTFNFYNDKNNATLSTINGITFYTTGDRLSKFNADIVRSQMVFNISNGEVNIDKIGDEAHYYQLSIEASKSKFNIGSMYGVVKCYGDTSAVNNSIYIKEYYNNSSTKSDFVLGSGELNIQKLIGSATFSSTTGNINVKNISKESSVYAISTFGNINLAYEYTDEKQPNTVLTIFTSKGDIVIDNISCKFLIEVLSSSENSKLDLTISAVVKDTESPVRYNKIKAGNRNVDIKLKGTSEALLFRLACTSNSVTKDFLNHSKIKPDDIDAFLTIMGLQNDYSFSYRINYMEPTSITFASKGLLFINGEKSINIKSIGSNA